MTGPEVSTFPWATLVSGLVGIAGIGGTLLSAHLTSRAAETRRLAEQLYADRTRFHKERVEIYARFISAMKLYRDSVIKHRAPIFDSDPQDGTPLPEIARTAFAAARETLLLVAADDVGVIADRVFGATTTLAVGNKMSKEVFEQWDQVALTALAEFRKAARLELLTDRATTKGR
jgi:hypothetical protein